MTLTLELLPRKMALRRCRLSGGRNRPAKRSSFQAKREEVWLRSSDISEGFRRRFGVQVCYADLLNPKELCCLLKISAKCRYLQPEG